MSFSDSVIEDEINKALAALEKACERFKVNPVTIDTDPSEILKESATNDRHQQKDA